MANPLTSREQTRLLLGRRRELARLTALFDLGASGSPTVAFLVGEQGAGRTRLLQALRTILLDRGAVVVESNCANQAGLSPAFGRLWEAVHQWTAESGTGAQAHARLAAILRSPGLYTDAESGLRADIVAQTARMLRIRSQTTPVALLLDDFQDADPTSLSLFESLLIELAPSAEFESPRAFRGLVVVSWRGDEAEIPLWTASLRHELISLQRLEERDLAESLGDETVARRLVWVTGGAPQRLHSLLTYGHADPEAGLEEAFEALGPTARDLLTVCAVFHDSVGLSDLAAMLQWPTVKVAEAIDEALRSPFLEHEVRQGELRLRFGSQASRQFVLDHMDRETVRRWHERAADWAAARRDPVSEALYRLAAWDGSPETLERTATAILEAGAKLEASGAWEQALETYESFLKVLSETARDSLREEDRTWQAAVASRCWPLLDRSGAFEHGLELLERLGLGTWESLFWRGMFLLRLGRPKDARATFQEALQRADDAEQKLATQVRLAECALSFGEYRTAEQEIGAVLAAPVLSSRVESAALTTKGLILMRTEGPGEALSAFRRASQIAEAAGHDEEHIRALVNMGIAQLAAGHRTEAERLYREALEQASDRRYVRLAAYCQQNLAVLAHWNRNYGEALRRFHEAAQSLTRLGNELLVAWVAADLADLYLELGVDGKAREMARRARAILERSDPHPRLERRLATTVEARLLAEAGRVLQAKKVLLQARADAARRGSDEEAAVVGLELARLELKLGDIQKAQRILQNLPGTGMPKLEGWRSLLEAECLLAAESSPQEAAEVLRRALSCFEEADDPDGRWKTMAWLAEAFRRARQEDQARFWMERARKLERRIFETVPTVYRDDYERAAVRADYLALLKSRRGDTVEDTNRSLRTQSESGPRLVGRHPEFLRALRAIERVAKTDATVLLLGESGTGKELAAEAIHHASRRRNGPLVKVNCAALVDTLLLSELFGHERGAFTGAVRQKIGRFELANGGTIFLDEIGDISPRTQVALLRVLQERTFERVGGTEPIHVDVRVVCATNRNLEELVRQGKFREDLYYRLKGVEITLPPLRHRLSDIPLLARHVLEELASEQESQPKRLSADAEELLRSHSWPGNVRELWNVLRSAVIFSEGDVITADDLREFIRQAPSQASHREELREEPDPLPEPASPQRNTTPEAFFESAYHLVVGGGLNLRDFKKEMERALVAKALRETGGNITRAAQLLGMKRPRLSQLVKEYGLNPRGRREP